IWQIFLPGELLRAGANQVVLEFRADDMALNRREEYLYTLFVPDRAATAFPCFDQPDLKAVFRLELEVPASWTAVSNAAVVAEKPAGDRRLMLFGETEPISTYLFAFAAGEFEIENYELLGRQVRMFHRESRRDMHSANLEAIFQLHSTALSWLEEYTDIPYPFSKFDFVVIPDFQFGGMEHPGAVFYKASRLFLEETATQDDLLGRASLIAHEVAHMWFGDLVTMTWFDDVWMKEVFANFFAAKIVNPSFPDVRHDLRFFLEHYPAAYEIDRSSGTHPIRQKLANLNEAASLYGAIIYQKAPIVMRQLEALVGAEEFRQGMREYLEEFRFGNASWPDLIEILDKHSKEDTRGWSRAWVEEEGRPTVSTETDADADGVIRKLSLKQRDPLGRDRVWLQPMTLFLGDPRQGEYFPTWTRGGSSEIPEAQGKRREGAILVNGAGWGYALTVLDPSSQRLLLRDLPRFQEPMIRAVALVSLWDGLLEERVEPSDFVDLGLRTLAVEQNELILERLLGYLEQTYWRFIGGQEREEVSQRFETTLWTRLEGAQTTTAKALFFQTFCSIARSDEALEKLISLWEGSGEISGLEIAEMERIDLAFELALKGVPESSEMLLRELEQQDDPERRQRIEFLLPSVSSSVEDRRKFFESLAEVENRAYETWVLEGLRNLHHPLRAEESIDLLEPGLELVLEVEQTGSIFFPKRWLDSLFTGHRSKEAAATVSRFLEERPSYPTRLVLKIRQSADLLYRAASHP
ncbi:MAG TPA: M1 family aminopeptidase, partial [Acidobacteriota bacterium]|nr:M1 family aminopeptidase [Acidobacteriota bacterium]